MSTILQKRDSENSDLLANANDMVDMLANLLANASTTDAPVLKKAETADPVQSSEAIIKKDGVVTGASKAKGQALGVRMSWLHTVLARLPRRGMTTLEVVEEFIKPATSLYRCRYADLVSVRDEGAIGPAKVFLSHCWGGLFIDLVAAAAHVLGPDDYCWIDIFAVNQHGGTAEQASDLDFEPVVKDCGAVVLVAKHLESVYDMTDNDDIPTNEIMSMVAAEDRKACAFWRVWCLAEMAAALSASLPVVMLIGHADDSKGSLEFVPNSDMVMVLYHFLDVRDADATVATDIPFIFDELVPKMLGENDREQCITRLNSLAKGCLYGSTQVLENPEIARAALGDTAALGKLLTLERGEQWEKLGVAANGGFLEVVRALIDAGVDVKSDGPKDDNVLASAIVGGNVAVVELLLQAGADLSPSGWDTPLLVSAVQAGHLPILEVLLRAGADVEAAARYGDEKGLTALMAAGQKAWGQPFVEALLRGGANVNHADHHGCTALGCAAGGKSQVVELLLQAGADANTADRDGCTPLMFSAVSGLAPAVEALLRAGADVNAECATFDMYEVEGDGAGNLERVTALMLSARVGHVPVVEALLRAGAVNSGRMDSNGRTALDHAEQKGHRPVVEALLRAEGFSTEDIQKRPVCKPPPSAGVRDISFVSHSKEEAISIVTLPNRRIRRKAAEWLVQGQLERILFDLEGEDHASGAMCRLIEHTKDCFDLDKEADATLVLLPPGGTRRSSVDKGTVTAEEWAVVSALLPPGAHELTLVPIHVAKAALSRFRPADVAHSDLASALERALEQL